MSTAAKSTLSSSASRFTSSSSSLSGFFRSREKRLWRKRTGRRCGCSAMPKIDDDDDDDDDDGDDPGGLRPFRRQLGTRAAGRLPGERGAPEDEDARNATRWRRRLVLRLEGLKVVSDHRPEVLRY